MKDQAYRQIHLLAATGAFGDGLARGVLRYARASTNWRVTTASLTGERARRLASQGGGLIVQATDAALQRYIRKCGTPAVNVSGAIHEPLIPTCRTDDDRIGRMAANDLADKGLRSLVVLTHGNHSHTQRRARAFMDAARGRNIEARAYHFDRPAQFDRRFKGNWIRFDHLATWLGRQAFPLGVYCVSDSLAVQVNDACRAGGLHVPEQVAILGTDNASILCEGSFPPISSVALPLEQIGLRAAEMLDRQFRGERMEHSLIELPPLRVVQRQSTDVFAIADPSLRRALECIRDRASGVLGVDDVVAESGVCRTLLQRAFRRTLGRTILEEIHRARIERAKRLLLTTDLPIAQIATQSGFRSAIRFSTLFSAVQGQSPREFRRSRLLPVETDG